jgi:anti-sigma regulatory factor (Ser/Thr protein kinase)
VFNAEHEKVVSWIVPPVSDQGSHYGERDPAGPGLPRLGSATDGFDTELHFVLTADWVSPSLARERIRRWLGERRWPRLRIDELVLAVNEVVSNSIEHGYGLTADKPKPVLGVVEVDGRVSVGDSGFSRAVVTVTDHGNWREPDPGPSNRGRGMLLTRACTDNVVTEHRGDGTTVVLYSRPIPPPLVE